MYNMQNIHEIMHKTKTKSGLLKLKIGTNRRFFAFYIKISKNLNKYSFWGLIFQKKGV